MPVAELLQRYEIDFAKSTSKSNADICVENIKHVLRKMFPHHKTPNHKEHTEFALALHRSELRCHIRKKLLSLSSAAYRNALNTLQEIRDYEIIADLCSLLAYSFSSKEQQTAYYPKIHSYVCLESDVPARLYHANCKFITSISIAESEIKNRWATMTRLWKVAQPNIQRDERNIIPQHLGGLLDKIDWDVSANASLFCLMTAFNCHNMSLRLRYEHCIQNILQKISRYTATQDKPSVQNVDATKQLFLHIDNYVRELNLPPVYFKKVAQFVLLQKQLFQLYYNIEFLESSLETLTVSVKRRNSNEDNLPTAARIPSTSNRYCMMDMEIFSLLDGCSDAQSRLVDLPAVNTQEKQMESILLALADTLTKQSECFIELSTFHDTSLSNDQAYKSAFMSKANGARLEVQRYLRQLSDILLRTNTEDTAANKHRIPSLEEGEYSDILQTMDSFCMIQSEDVIGYRTALRDLFSRLNDQLLKHQTNGQIQLELCIRICSVVRTLVGNLQFSYLSEHPEKKEASQYAQTFYALSSSVKLLATNNEQTIAGKVPPLLPQALELDFKKTHQTFIQNLQRGLNSKLHSDHVIEGLLSYCRDIAIAYGETTIGPLTSHFYQVSREYINHLPLEKLYPLHQLLRNENATQFRNQLNYLCVLPTSILSQNNPVDNVCRVVQDDPDGGFSLAQDDAADPMTRERFMQFCSVIKNCSQFFEYLDDTVMAQLKKLSPSKAIKLRGLLDGDGQYDWRVYKLPEEMQKAATNLYENISLERYSFFPKLLQQAESSSNSSVSSGSRRESLTASPASSVTHDALNATTSSNGTMSSISF